MDSVRSWALTICFACVLGSIFAMIFPENSSKKLLNMIISMMILCVIFKPIASLGEFVLQLDESSFEVSEYENSELEDQIASDAEKIYSSYLRENLERILNENNINYENIVINMDTSENYSISIGQVEVVVKSEDVVQAEKIKNLLYDYIGKEPLVTKVGE